MPSKKSIQDDYERLQSVLRKLEQDIEKLKQAKKQRSKEKEQ